MNNLKPNRYILQQWCRPETMGTAAHENPAKAVIVTTYK